MRRSLRSLSVFAVALPTAEHTDSPRHTQLEVSECPNARSPAHDVVHQIFSQLQGRSASNRFPGESESSPSIQHRIETRHARRGAHKIQVRDTGEWVHSHSRLQCQSRPPIGDVEGWDPLIMHDIRNYWMD